MIDVDHASIRFPTRTGHVDAVRNASFAVRDGEVFGLVGESGSVAAHSRGEAGESKDRCALSAYPY